MRKETFEKVVPYLPDLDRIALYGYGEPSEGPLLEFLKEIRKNFDGEITLVTNGLRPLRGLLKQFSPGKLVFSVDFPEGIWGIKGATGAMLKNMRECLEEARKRGLEVEIGSEVVLMKKNLEKIPKLVKMLRDVGASFVEISNLIPYFEEMIPEICYLTLSRGVFEKIFGREEKMIEEMDKRVYEALRGVYSESFESFSEIYGEFLSDGYLGANPHLLTSYSDLGIVRNYMRAVEILEEARRIEGIEVRPPKMIAEAKERRCPYLSEGFLFLRVDGKVTPCMEFSYSHPLYVNGHVKKVREVVLGEVSSLDEVLRSETLLRLKKATSDFSSIPWCGDCPYSSLGCWYSEGNFVDCMGNSPSCDECLYSAGISKCVL